MSETTRFLSASECDFRESESGHLRLTVQKEFSCLDVVFRRLFPLKDPGHFVSVGDGGKEVGIIRDLTEFDRDTQALIRLELDFYYAVPEITDIKKIKGEYDYFHWDTVTDRGPRSFYVKGRTEGLKIKGSHLQVTDIENCRYELPDVGALSESSRRILEAVM